METLTVKVGNISIGSAHPIVVQTMCNTHTSDVEASVEQCKRLAAAGAQIIRLTVPSMTQVESLKEIKNTLRKEGIDIPIIPGIKPFRKLSQLTVIPKTFKVDIPQELALEALKCKTDDEANALGIEWCINQCKELIKFGVPSIHFYTVGAVDSIKQVAKAIY